MSKDWSPMIREPADGSTIWICRMVEGEPQDIRPAISNGLPWTWPTHWKPRAPDQREYKI